MSTDGADDHDPLIAEKFAMISRLDPPDLWARIEQEAAGDQTGALADPQTRRLGLRRALLAAVVLLVVGSGLWLAATANKPDGSLTTLAQAGDGPTDTTDAPPATPTPEPAAPAPARIDIAPESSDFVGDSLVETLNGLGFNLAADEAACVADNAPTETPADGQLKSLLRSLVDECLDATGPERLADAIFEAPVRRILPKPDQLTSDNIECLIENADFGERQFYSISVCGLLGQVLFGSSIEIGADTVRCVDAEGQARPFDPGPEVYQGAASDPTLPYLDACGSPEEIEYYRAMINDEEPEAGTGLDPGGFVGDALVGTLNDLGFGLAADEAACLTEQAPTAAPTDDELKPLLRSLVDQCLDATGPERLADAIFGIRLSALLRSATITAADTDCLIDNADFGANRGYALSVCGFLGQITLASIPGMSADTIDCVDREGITTPFTAMDDGSWEDPELLPYLDACATPEEIEFYLYG